MTTYIMSSLCSGHRPRNWSRANIVSRQNIVARLMRDRSLLRLLVAPSGYGKTFSLLEYCATLDAFEHTLWMDASSPCFLRELDKGTFAADIIAKKGKRAIRIVVVDDIPNLGPDRADALSCFFDELIGANIEVLASCRPSCDAFAARQIDRETLEARDLMLSDSELLAFGKDGVEGACSNEMEQCEKGSGVDLSRRIPVLAWAQEGATRKFARGMVAEDLVDEVLAAQLMVVTLGSGSISWACNRCGVDPQLLAILRKSYPHLGISVENDQFDAVPVDIAALDTAFSSHLDTLAPCFGLRSRDEVCALLADVLLEKGDASRACCLLTVMASQAARMAWLLTRGEALFGAFCLEPAWRLCDSLYKRRADAEGSCLDAHQAWRTYLLGDAREASKLAFRVTARDQAPREARAWSLLLLARISRGEAKQKVLEALAAMMPRPVSYGEIAGAQDSWVVLAAVVLLMGERESSDKGARWRDASQVVAAWHAFAELAPSAGIAFFAGACLLELCPDLARDELMARYAHQAIEHVGTADFEAFRKIAELAACGALPDEEALLLMSEDALDAFQQAEGDLIAQQRRFSHVKHAEEQRKALRNKQTHAGEGSRQTYVPQLSVSLFGGVEVTIGGRLVEGEKFTKTRMRALLALLVEASGREVSREQVMRDLWPLSSSDTARKNLYTNWAELVRALTLPDGTCPYLCRLQGGYRIDRRYVVSDVERVSDICREMTMDRVDAARLRILLEELDRLYRGDFVPAEAKLAVILDTRRDYRTKVTNALVHATLRLIDMDEPQLAIWAARKALDHERELESPYFALMSAQISCGQREAAILTYRQCVDMLNRSYRIDPSGRMVDLYRQLVVSEETF